MPVSIFHRDALVGDPGPPLRFQVMNVPAGRGATCQSISARIETQCSYQERLDGMLLHRTLSMHDHITAPDHKSVIWHVIVLIIISDDLTD